jgi:hypothetical protein
MALTCRNMLPDVLARRVSGAARDALQCRPPVGGLGARSDRCRDELASAARRT